MCLSASSECASCKEDQKKGKMIQLDCLHQFCTRCMEESIKNSMRDETLFPPSCCQAEIPQKVIKSTLTKQDQELYMSKTQEFRIPRSERFYCPEETCKSWIPPSAIGEGAVINCATCRTYICRTRQGKAHPPHKPCPQVPNQKNTGTQAINGWRECFKCRSMVEAVEGYNIMICGCGAEFCYSCGNVWKTCNCQDHNHRLSPHLSIFDPQSILMPRIAEQRQQQTRQSQEEDKRTAQRQAQGENQRQAEAAAAAEEKSRQLSAKYTALEQKLETLHSRQRSLVHSRHERETQALQRTLSAGKTSHLLSLQEEKTNLLTRQASEKATLEATFQKERTELSEKHSADEDDYWFSLQTYLRDRPNKEARQKALMDKLTVAQKEEMTGLAMQQEERLAASLADIDRRLHEVEDEIRRGAQDNGERRKDLARRQWAEWKWFKVILERRVAVLVEEREVEEKRERERGYSVHMLGGYLQAKEVEG
ncbi:hypothetical protein L873DRAFT_1688180 [Choiromyces venosus 120613-1]|uniref:RING-type domain-containing protein n=1 Tax=Choiromyces venosus 120613-1 TaxID=1336337 RepID=A0A3N4JJD8_9PEZI|nr:hypothetical protein L873DRAFT_1688180 [Choiromyces venosus 120613-1]